jgi:hypothetical protein
MWATGRSFSLSLGCGDGTANPYRSYSVSCNAWYKATRGSRAVWIKPQLTRLEEAPIHESMRRRLVSANGLSRRSRESKAVQAPTQL